MASLTDDLVQQLLAGRHIASLATVNPDNSIHMVAVWFWFDGSTDFCGHVFAQPQSTEPAIQREGVVDD